MRRGAAAWLPLVALLAVAGPDRGAVAAEPGPPAILGVWKGTSTCVDREIAPACKDEVTLYTFTKKEGGPAGTITLQADKIVDGKREPMGDLDGIWDEAKGTWTCDMRTPRVNAVWSFTVAGKELAGSLVDVPTKKKIRKIEARKE